MRIFLFYIILLSTIIFHINCSRSGSNAVPELIYESKMGERMGEANYSISGTITIPKNTDADKFMQIAFWRKMTKKNIPFNEMGFGSKDKKTTTAKTIKYTINKLPKGEYVVGMRIDQTGNGMLNDSGDIEGYSGGNIAQPVRSDKNTKTITITDQSIIGIDFGLGVK